MEYIIINDLNEKLVVKPGDNDTVVMIRKRRLVGVWKPEVTILNKREALLVLQAFQGILNAMEVD